MDLTGKIQYLPGQILMSGSGLAYSDDRIHPAHLAADRIRFVGNCPVGMDTIGVPPFQFEIRIVVGSEGGFPP